MSEPSLPEKVDAIHTALDARHIEHAFGGALALAYYAEPRATDDVDVNVFLAPDRFDELADTLRPLGIDVTVDQTCVALRDGQSRLWWGRTPIDVFLAYDQLHVAMRAECRSVPFGESWIPILAPQHLVVCKVLFDRPKDWLDVEQILVCVDDLNIDAVFGELDRTVGSRDARLERIRDLVERGRDA